MKASVIIATLGRPSLRDTLDALKNQTLPRSEWEVLTWTGGCNEYEARNQAAQVAKGGVLAFTDDDTTPPPDWLERGLAHFQEDPELRILTGPVEGCLWGQAWMKVSKPGWFIGANIMARREAFLEVGGFEVTWGLDPPPRGWRGDTDLGWRMIDRFGEKCYGHFEDVRMVHSRQMQSQCDFRVEAEFYKRHRTRCLELIAPYDPRLCQLVVDQGLEKDPAALEYLTGLLMRFAAIAGDVST